ncbi:MAG: mechanosensitive ion channel family protein [Pseudonocardiales bacterium]
MTTPRTDTVPRVTPAIAQPDCVQDDGSWCSRIYRLTNSDLLARYSDTVINAGLQILLIVVVAVVIRLLLHRAINRLIQVIAQGPPPGLLRSLGNSEPRHATAPLSQRRAARARAIGSVLRSATTAMVYGVGFAMVLGALGVNLGPIIASAGIVGLAVGFGSQTLVKDLLSGLFMMIEDQYGVGDEVDLGEVSGTVEAVGLRVTTVRDVSGALWYVRNGEVLRVGNSSQGPAVAVVDLPIGHDADIAAATELAGRIAAKLTGENGALAADILEPPEVLGVQSISADSVTLRVTATVRAGQQSVVQRALLAGIKDAFGQAGIPSPTAIRPSGPPG